MFAHWQNGNIIVFLSPLASVDSSSKRNWMHICSRNEVDKNEIFI